MNMNETNITYIPMCDKAGCEHPSTHRGLAIRSRIPTKTPPRYVYYCDKHKRAWDVRIVPETSGAATKEGDKIRPLLQIEQNITKYTCVVCEERQAAVVGQYSPFSCEPMCRECAEEHRKMLQLEIRQLKNDLRAR